MFPAKNSPTKPPWQVKTADPESPALPKNKELLEWRFDIGVMLCSRVLIFRSVPWLSSFHDCSRVVISPAYIPIETPLDLPLINNFSSFIGALEDKNIGSPHALKADRTCNGASSKVGNYQLKLAF